MNWIKAVFIKVLSSAKLQKKQKEFGYLLLVILGVILCLSFYKHGFTFITNQKYVLIAFATILIITLTVIKLVLIPFLFFWLLIGECLGVITSLLIMAIVYFMLFSPITLILRIFKKQDIYLSEWKTVSRKIDYKKLS